MIDSPLLLHLICCQGSNETPVHRFNCERIQELEFHWRHHRFVSRYFRDGSDLVAIKKGRVSVVATSSVDSSPNSGRSCAVEATNRDQVVSLRYRIQLVELGIGSCQVVENGFAQSVFDAPPSLGEYR